MCGPGETPVGFDNSNPAAPAPLCPGNGQAPAAAVDSYSAIAWHPDASDVWVDGNYTGPNNVARGSALAACEKVMGEGCTIGGEWSNSWYFIYRNYRGDLYSAWAYDVPGLRARERECQGNQPLKCERILKVPSNQRHRNPGPQVRKRYLVAAWVEDESSYDGKLYISSGKPSYAIAAEEAKSACEAANPGKVCEIQDYSGGGVLQTYLSGKGDAVAIETTASRAKKSAQQACKAKNVKPCVLQAQFDARREGQFVHVFRPDSGK